MYRNKRMRLISVWLIALLALTMLPAAALAAEDGTTLTIFHVNDRHGRMDADPYLAALVKQADGPVLVFDAGDALHGQTTANLTKGAAMVELMNAVGYSAMAPGNHDFNFGVDRLLALSEMMEFPLLSANVKDSGGKNLFQAYEIFDANGLKVGVFGLTTPETVSKADPRIVKDLVFEEPLAAAEQMISVLEGEGCDIIVALTHLGVDNATLEKYRGDTLAKLPGIDIVIDGHSHSFFGEGLFVGDTLVAQTGSFTEHIGVITVKVNGDNIEKTASFFDVPKNEGDKEPCTPDESVLAKIAELDAANESLISAVVGYTPVKLEGAREFVRKEETNLTNVVTDSMRWATGADVAFLAGGNIRDSIDAGDITMGEVLTVLPFSNLLVTIEITGADLLAVLEHGVSAYPELAGSYIQVSGLRFTFDPAAQPGGRVTDVALADGGILEPNEVYTVTTIDFIASGGDGYTMLQNGTELKYFGGDAAALVSYLETKPDIKDEPEGRVTALASQPVPVPDPTPVPQPEPEPEPVPAPAPVPQPVPVPEPAQANLYVVQSGDNLTKIAAQYNTTWRTIYNANKDKIRDPNLIYPGQELVIPAA